LNYPYILYIHVNTTIFSYFSMRAACHVDTFTNKGASECFRRS